MLVVVEIENYHNPDVENGIGVLSFIVLFFGWLFVFVAMFIAAGITELATRGEDDYFFAAVLVPSVLVSIIAILLIWAVVSSPYFP